MSNNEIKNVLNKYLGHNVGINFKTISDETYESGIIKDVNDFIVCLEYRTKDGTSVQVFVNIEEIRVLRFWDGPVPAQNISSDDVYEKSKYLSFVLPEKVKGLGFKILEYIFKIFLKKEKSAIVNIYYHKFYDVSDTLNVINRIDSFLKGDEFIHYRNLINNNIKNVYLMNWGKHKYYPFSKAIIVEASISENYLYFFSILILLSLYISYSKNNMRNYEELHRKVLNELLTFLEKIPDDTKELQVYYKNMYRRVI